MSSNNRTEGTAHITWSLRLLSVTFAAYCFFHIKDVQTVVDNLYSWLLTTWLFQSVYFETIWVVLTYPVILSIPKFMDAIPYWDQYKIHPKTHWPQRLWLDHLREAGIYAAPFLLLDTFIVKKYAGVDPIEWTSRRASLIQYTRALPDDAPLVGDIVKQLLGALIIYDILFFLVHLACHKNMFLYQQLHAVHHDHEILTSRVSNQLTIAERILLVLCANESLKIMGGHPLTRLIFVPIFLYWLMENHLGYDAPWGLHRIVPFGLVGGSVRHYHHHLNGCRYYQPFFTYIDDWIYP